MSDDSKNSAILPLYYTLLSKAKSVLLYIVIKT